MGIGYYQSGNGYYIFKTYKENDLEQNQDLKYQSNKLRY